MMHQFKSQKALLKFWKKFRKTSSWWALIIFKTSKKNKRFWYKKTHFNCKSEFFNFQHFTSSFFCMKVFRAAFLFLHCRFILFRRKDISAKAPHKMFVKLTTESKERFIRFWSSFKFKKVWQQEEARVKSGSTFIIIQVNKGSEIFLLRW